MNGKAKALYDNCVEVLCGQQPSDPKLVEAATGNWLDGNLDPFEGAKLLILALKAMDQEEQRPKSRRGRPKGSKNKAADNGASAEAPAGDNGASTEAPAAAAPRKRRGRPPTRRAIGTPPADAPPPEDDTPPQDDTLTA